jgi:hypothetical protein
MSTRTCQDQIQLAITRSHVGHKSPAEEAPRNQKKANGEHPHPQEAASGSPESRPPGRALRAPGEGPERPEHRATPGGYGGKPPGVAIIGVPTGARNAGSDAPTGDQSIDMNRTRKHPLVCQDPITTRSRDEPEQAQSLTIRNHRRQGRRGGGRFPCLLLKTRWSRGWRAGSDGTP